MRYTELLWFLFLTICENLWCDQVFVVNAIFDQNKRVGNPDYEPLKAVCIFVFAVLKVIPLYSQ